MAPEAETRHRARHPYDAGGAPPRHSLQGARGRRYVGCNAPRIAVLSRAHTELCDREEAGWDSPSAAIPGAGIPPTGP